MLPNQKSLRHPAAFLLFALLAICAASAAAQTNKLPVGNANFVSSTKIGAMTVAEVNQGIEKAFGTSVSPTASPLDLYKINYRSTDEKNNPVVLSGLVVLPRGGAPNGLVIFNHGTIVNSESAPSRFTGTATKSGTEVPTLAFASGGYAVAMPDYLGLGDDTGAHPYPLGAINSLSAVDIIEPARYLAAQQNTPVGARLFVTGYSEGGAVAMWTVRNLEKKSGAIYNVSAAAPASGPYDLSGTTRNWLLASPTDDQAFVVRLYLTAYMAYYFHKSSGIKLTDYFKPAMALTVSLNFKGNISDEDLLVRLAVAAALMRPQKSLVNVLNPSFVQALQTLDTSDPTIRAMQKNDCYDWAPRTKMLLINLQGDKVVDPGNTEKAFQTMRQRGVGANVLRRYEIKDTSLNHLTAMAPAMAQARRFFDGKFAGD
jgi:alpha/beta superfamily hydrolase